jgi:hypothetical protein
VTRRLVGSLAVAGGVLAVLTPALEHASRPLAAFTVGVVATAGLRHGMVQEIAHADSRRQTRTVDTANVIQATADISADIHFHGVDEFLAGCRFLAGPVPDPGHPGGMLLALWQPPARYGRVLVLGGLQRHPRPRRPLPADRAPLSDPRVGPSATYGKDWLPGVHARQLQRLARRSERDGTPG